MCELWVLLCVDVCANTQVCIHRFAHMLLVCRSRRDIWWVWGEFELLVGRVGRQAGLVLGPFRPEVPLGSPCQALFQTNVPGTSGREGSPLPVAVAGQIMPR